MELAQAIKKLQEFEKDYGGSIDVFGNTENDQFLKNIRDIRLQEGLQDEDGNQIDERVVVMELD